MSQEFHVHVDAWEIAPEFVEALQNDWSFMQTDFDGHPDGVEGYEPKFHLTYKTNSSVDFKRVFDEVVAIAKQGIMRGYIEGEFLPLDEDIQETSFDPSVVPPVRRFCLGRVPEGNFRGSEIHVVMDKDRSDPRLLEILAEMGMFCAYMKKPYGTAVIFTVGGTRSDIASVVEPLREYLDKAGGSVNGSIKEERIADYWLSSANLRLPPVVKTIEWSHLPK